MPTDLPPIGTRWGDLTPEQRAALPEGTRLGPAFSGSPTRTRSAGSWRLNSVPDMLDYAADRDIHPDRRILSYPEPTP